MLHGAGRVSRALDHPYAAAVSLVSGALVALTWSAISSSNYHHAVTVAWFDDHALSAHSVVLDGVMTLFFASVGLELSSELRSNLRHHLHSALSPLFGAVGGMCATALGSLALGEMLHSSALRRGWGVPMATDIAFTLGVLALAGTRVPSHLRIFLLTLAIADDVLSVAILSATGVTHLRMVGLLAIVVVTLVGIGAGRRLPALWVFMVMIVPMWLAFEWTGVEPALSGVVVGLVIPVTANSRLEATMTRWSSAVALPFFALVACGVTWASLSLSGNAGKVIFGTVLVRLVGKVLGIGAGVAVAGVLGARRHESITPLVLLGATLLCAIGFTVPLLFAGALFGASSATYGAFTVGLLGASVLGAIFGVTVLRRATR
jgi:NhaA family Na+:H+ antiporter